jgi:hypothetical protein
MAGVPDYSGGSALEFNEIPCWAVMAPIDKKEYRKNSVWSQFFLRLWIGACFKTGYKLTIIIKISELYL